jgi:hypothetical protein
VNRMTRSTGWSCDELLIVSSNVQKYGCSAMIVSTACVARYCNAFLYLSNMVGGKDGVTVFATRCLESKRIEDISGIS